MDRMLALVELAKKYEPLVHLADLDTESFDSHELPSDSDIKEYQERLEEECKEFVVENYKGWDTREELENNIASDITNLRNQSHESWAKVIDKLETTLLSVARIQGSKSKTRRKIEYHGPWITIVIVITAYFSIRFLSAVHAIDDILETSGFLQRHNAFEKVLRYDDWMDTRVRRGGIFKSVLFWPIKPTDEEIGLASQYLGLVVEVSDYLHSNGKICPSAKQDLSDDLKTATFFSEFLSEQSGTQAKIEEPSSIIFIGESMSEMFPCQGK